MTFEEDFPSLKDKSVTLIKTPDKDYKEVEGHIFDYRIIQNNCLDKSIVDKQYLPKQKVKDAMKKVLTGGYDYPVDGRCYEEYEKLLKELNLE